jgi:hypothetical protein
MSTWLIIFILAVIAIPVFLLLLRRLFLSGDLLGISRRYERSPGSPAPNPGYPGDSIPKSLLKGKAKPPVEP